MLLRIVLFSSIFVALVSCVNKKNAILNNSNQREFVCGGNLRSPEKEKIQRGISIFQMGFAVKGSDTLYPPELICLDSLKFTQTLLADVKVNEICLEMGIQGVTYFSARTNKYGGFEDVKVVRSLESCFRNFEEDVISKVSKMRILQEEYFSSEIVFRHKYVIH